MDQRVVMHTIGKPQRVPALPNHMMTVKLGYAAERKTIIIQCFPNPNFLRHTLSTTARTVRHQTWIRRRNMYTRSRITVFGVMEIATRLAVYSVHCWSGCRHLTGN